MAAGLPIDLRDATDRPFVSVVMAIRNEEAVITDSLLRLMAQDYPAARTEIIVVDGDSDDATIDRVKEVIVDHPDRDITLLHNPDRIVPISLNLAIRASRGDIIVRMDGHAFMADDYISACVRSLDEHDADVVGGPLETKGHGRFGRAVAYAQSSPAGIGNSHFRYANKGIEVPTVPFGTFRREAFERAGLFDESMVRNQDYEMNTRIRDTGGKIYLDPRVRVSYRPRGTLRGLWRQHVEYGWWRVETLRRHPDSARPNHVLPLLLVAGLLLPIPLLRARLIRWGWQALVATYGSFVAAGTLVQIRRGARAELPGVALAIMAMQVGYGLGSLMNVATGGRWPYGPVVAKVPELPPRAEPVVVLDELTEAGAAAGGGG